VSESRFYPERRKALALLRTLALAERVVPATASIEAAVYLHFSCKPYAHDRDDRHYEHYNQPEPR
jgi:hypothetical protein